MALKSNYGFYLTAELKSTDTSVTISNVIETGDAVSLSTETSLLLFYEDKPTEYERCKGTATGGTLTLSKRGLDNSASPSEVTANKKTWRPGTRVKVTQFADDLIDIDADMTIPGDWTYSGDIVYSKSMNLPVYADATARDAAITSPSNGMIIYNTAEGLLQEYIGGTWTNMATGSVSNASTTVAGKVEVATDAENTSGAETGDTGATLSVTPKANAKVIQSGSYLYCGASSAGTDTYAVTMTPTLTAYTTGMSISFKADVANTGACTINVNTLGAKSIKTLDGNDPQDGAVRVGHNVLIYDGTNFVLQTEDIATTTNKGIVELATDAEVVTGTDETRYVNPKQLRANSASAIGTTTRTTADSTGTQNIAHGLGQIPRLVEFTFTENESSASAAVICHGYYDGTNNYCVATRYDSSLQKTRMFTSNCIYYVKSSGGWTATAAIDATNIILSRTKDSSGIDIDVVRKAIA